MLISVVFRRLALFGHREDADTQTLLYVSVFVSVLSVSHCNYQCRKKCRAKTDKTGIVGNRQRAQDSPNQGGVKSVIPRHSNQTGVTVCVLYLRRHPSKDRERLDRKEDGPFVDHRPRADMQ